MSEHPALDALLRATGAVPKPKPAPKGKRRWVTLGYEPVVMPEVPTPEARGYYLDESRPPAPDPDREVRSEESYRALMFGHEAALDAPDDRPTPAAKRPEPAVIRVPRRTKVIDGAGEREPKPTRWGLPPRDGQRTNTRRNTP